MVSTGPTALDVHDHRVVRHLVGDAQHGADLRDGTRLERHVCDADLGQLGDQRDGLFQLRNARGDDDTVERRTRGTGLLHQTFTAELQLPQVRVEEQRVELHRAARVQQRLQLGHSVGEDLLGDLTTTGQLRPVAGIRRRRDDFRVDGGRGHAREQDRRTARQFGERSLDHDASARQTHRARREGRPRLSDLGHRTGSQQTALTRTGRGRDNADAGALERTAGEAAEQIAGAQIENPLRTSSDNAVDLLDPVDRVDEDLLRQRTRELRIQTTLRRPTAHDVDRVGERGVMEGHIDGQILEDRREHRTTARLRIALAGLRVMDLSAMLTHPLQLGRRTGKHHAPTTVANRNHRCRSRIHASGHLGHHRAQLLGIDIRHRDHRRTLAHRHQTTAARNQTRCGTDHLGNGEEFGVALPTGLHRGRGEAALRMPDNRDRRVLVRIQTLQPQRPHRCHLRQEYARHGNHRRPEHLLRRRTGNLRFVTVGELVLEHPADRVEPDRSHDKQLRRDGFQQLRRFVDQCGQLGLQCGIAPDLLQLTEPTRTLPTEGQRVGRFAQQSIQQRGPRTPMLWRPNHFRALSGSGRSALIDRQDASTSFSWRHAVETRRSLGCAGVSHQ